MNPFEPPTSPHSPIPGDPSEPRLYKLASEALIWRERLLDDERSVREGFTDWLLQSADHVRAWLEQTAFDEELARWRGHPEFGAVAAAVAPGVTRDPSTHAPNPSGGDTFARRTGRASLVSGLAVLTLAATSVVTQSAVGHLTSYSTAIGEQRRLILSDGSVLTLNTGSRIVVQMSSVARRVQIDRGEVLFDLAPDGTRPFRVRVGHTQIDDVGTRFSVRATSPRQVSILVSEGRVRISPTPDSTGASVLELSAGEATELDTSKRRPLQPVARLEANEVQQRLLWTKGRVFFAGAPLKEAVEEMNRYSRRRLLVEDPGLAEVRIGGVFNTGDPIAFAEALSQLGFCNVEPAVRAQPNGSIRLVPTGEKRAKRVTSR